jgi:AraC family transcriptional regulator
VAWKASAESMLDYAGRIPRANFGGDLSRRWTLHEIAAEMKGSAVYLTQVFQQVEGLPLYQYHLRLRLARALDLIAERAHLSGLAQDVGFSSHSLFSAALKQI